MTLPPTRKIVFVIPELGTGGAERVLSWLAGRFAETGRWRVVVIPVAGVPSDGPFHPFPPAVMLRPLALDAPAKNPFDALRANIRRVAALRAVFAAEKPDIAVAFIHKAGIWTLLAAAGLRLPVIVCERIDPHGQNLGRVWTALRFALYPFARAIAVQTKNAAQYFPKRLQQKITVIPNPVFLPHESATFSATRNIVAAGRLTRQKGFDILIESFTRLAADFPDWSVTIYGDGPERPVLEQAVRSKGLEGRIRLPGLTRPGEDWRTGAEIFVLSSRFEGFPNVLGEALAGGLAVVAAACPSGVTEMVRNGQNGLLVPPENPQALAAALKTLMTEDQCRAALGKAARESLSAYDPDSIFGLWTACINGALPP